MIKNTILIILVIIVLVLGAWAWQIYNRPEDTLSATSTRILKDVGEAYLEDFGLEQSDFESIHQNGFTIIEGNFDICADEQEVELFLDRAHDASLLVILTAGAGEAEWGYACDQPVTEGQKPRWEKDKVTAWINQWKNHPALYAWDSSNEAGGNFPNSETADTYLSVEQLREAYQTIKSVDDTHPVIIRMNGWVFYENETDFFNKQNPFAANVADIVMVNAYSNVDGYDDQFVITVVENAIDSLKTTDPNIQIIPALGIWQEPPIWVKPTLTQLKQDLRQLENLDIDGISFFKYGAAGSEWYLPDSTIGAPELFNFLSTLKVKGHN